MCVSAAVVVEAAFLSTAHQRDEVWASQREDWHRERKTPKYKMWRPPGIVPEHRGVKRRWPSAWVPMGSHPRGARVRPQAHWLGTRSSSSCGKWRNSRNPRDRRHDRRRVRHSPSPSCGNARHVRAVL